MAIEIKIPKEIKDYKETFLFGLTVKKFVCLALTLVICIPLYIFGKKIMPEDMVSWVVILIAAPILCVGFVSYHGMSFTQLAKRAWNMFFHPQKRKYTELPVFWLAREQLIRENLLRETEIKRLAASGKRKTDTKKYQKYIVLTTERKAVKK